MVLTVIHGGSLRIYSRRPTLRWDEVPAGTLDQTLDTLRARGYAPYVLLDHWEESMFRDLAGERWLPTIAPHL